MDMYMVGGAVRDTLLGRESKDTDFVIVGSTPEKMLEMGFKQVGADFPVFLDEHGTEYALARTERKTGRGYAGFETDHGPSVTLEDDLMRRDLTINAMATPAFSSSFDVIDPFGGQEDLKNKVLRHVSPAFADDPVRVLRLARFHARYGPEWTVHPDTLAFCRKMADDGELDFLTRERVVAELLKAMSEPHPALFFKTLSDAGAMKVIFPEVAPKWSDPDKMCFEWQHPETYPTAEFAYARFTMMVDAKKMEDRLNVPTDFRKYASVMRFLFTTAGGLPVEDRIAALQFVDAFRQKDLFAKVVADLKAADFLAGIRRVVEAYELTKDISLSSLDKAKQEEVLRMGGRAISDAIREKRVEVLTEKTQWPHP